MNRSVHFWILALFATVTFGQSVLGGLYLRPYSPLDAGPVFLSSKFSEEFKSIPLSGQSIYVKSIIPTVSTIVGFTLTLLAMTKSTTSMPLTVQSNRTRTSATRSSINLNPMITTPPSLSTTNAIKVARFIIHHSNGGSLAYRSDDLQYPEASVYSISDGLPFSGTGVPYFMLSSQDSAYQALSRTESCSLIISLSQLPVCSSNQWDPQDPRCGQVILSGRFITLKNDTEEMIFARRVLWDKHPKMINWFRNMKDQDWKFAMLIIERVTMVNVFGGRQSLEVSDYLNQIPDRPINVVTV